MKFFFSDSSIDCSLQSLRYMGSGHDMNYKEGTASNHVGCDPFQFHPLRASNFASHHMNKYSKYISQDVRRSPQTSIRVP